MRERDGKFLECVYACPVCKAHGRVKPWMHTSETPDQTAHRHSMWTRGACLARCAYLATPAGAKRRRATMTNPSHGIAPAEVRALRDKWYAWASNEQALSRLPDPYAQAVLTCVAELETLLTRGGQESEQDKSKMLVSGAGNHESDASHVQRPTDGNPAEREG